MFNEYKQFKLLKKKDEMSSNMDVGSPAYIVSSKWLKAYTEFILFDQFEANVSEDSLKLDRETHFSRMHPGPMLNADELCEEDKDCKNLYGTGKVKGQEA